jgi:hypothetical protein
MILNALSITVVVVDLLTVVLLGWSGAKALRHYFRLRPNPAPHERLQVEDQSTLLFSLTVTVLIIRLFNWPFFYFTLASFIPQINGAMCLFGVTQVQGSLTLFEELIKPFGFFLIGGWLILHRLDRATDTGPLLKPKLLFLAFLSMVVLAEGIGELILFLSLSPTFPVSCCTTVTDILSRPTSTLPQSLLGPAYKTLLEILYFSLQGTLIALCLYTARAIKGQPPAGRKRLLLPGMVLLSLFNAVTFLLVYIESFAPRFMDLPFHHCLYCLWQIVPGSILLFLFFILGTMAPGWAWMVDLLGREGEAEALTPRYLKALLLFSAGSLAASLGLTLFLLLK